ncbi:glycine receptor subunit alpha-1 [Parasteatoda tepidariorum]|uniref:glycine receptor subunit alpha-1 n=1 Tax=Parasteatoda tepidariorum TaxID=114398 RepID=UPI00077F8517|nr:glycine receptor subunit alpha-1 [Parasteatoda tepidariorum]
MILKSPFLLFIAIIFFNCAYSKECRDGFCQSNNTAPLKFEDIVPNNYDKLVPPTTNGEPATVYIRIAVLNINFVDEAKQAFGVDIFFHQIWNDPRIKIPVSHNTSRLVLDSKWRHHLWTPDTYFKNFVDGKVNDIIIPYSYMILDKNSDLFFAARVSLKLDCEMNLASYPHDVQQCEISVMSLTHTTKNVVLKWKEFQITQNILLAQYYVSGNSSLGGTKRYSIGEFSFVAGRIHLARRLGYFLINKYIPCVLIICMSFVTFWIPAEAYPARVTLSVTSLLTIVTQQYQSAMPSVSYVVALNIWMLSCIGFVFCSLLEYAFVIAVMNNKGAEIWPFRKNLFPSSKAPRDQESDKAHSTTEVTKLSHQTIDKLSRLIFPLFFAIFCICYFVYFCRR